MLNRMLRQVRYERGIGLDLQGFPARTTEITGVQYRHTFIFNVSIMLDRTLVEAVYQN